MSEKVHTDRAVGEVVGYGKAWNIFSGESNVLVKVGGKVLKVSIDYRQKRFIQKVSPEGSRVVVRFYDGKWHIW